MGSLTLKGKLLAACLVFSASAFVLGGAFAQDAGAAKSKSDAYAWSNPGPREQLAQKAQSYFASTQGDFVNKIAMSRALDKTPSKDAQATSLGTQFNYVFTGVPDAETTLDGGEKLYSGCEAHNCVGNKAFLVTNPSSGAVEAAGFLGMLCGDARKNGPEPGQNSGATCDSTPTLTIFYPDRQSSSKPLSLSIIKWARNKVAADGHASKFRIQERFVH